MGNKKGGGEEEVRRMGRIRSFPTRETMNKIKHSKANGGNSISNMNNATTASHINSNSNDATIQITATVIATDIQKRLHHYTISTFCKINENWCNSAAMLSYSHSLASYICPWVLLGELRIDII